MLNIFNFQSNEEENLFHKVTIIKTKIGLSFAILQKMAKFDTFGKIVISRLIGLFFHAVFCIVQI